MNIYLAIKYHADQHNRAAIDAITAVLAAQGHTVFCVARDLEQWGAVTFAPDVLMRHSFAAIDAADLVLVELTEKGIGVGIEAGYAHANGIPVVTIAPTGADISETLRGIAATVFCYTEYADLSHLPLPTPDRQSKALTFWRSITSSVDRLLACLAGLDEAALNWRPLPNAGSLYVLATHIIGNIEETVLGLVCGQGVTRNREAEFQARGSDIVWLQSRWDTMQRQIQQHLAHLPPTDLARERLHPRRGPLTGWAILLVVARHAAEHLAHAELTRDLWLATSKGEHTYST
ncbi:MAG: DinB family protein [Caldilineaceae bacterium]